MVKFNLKNTAMMVSFCMIIQPILPFLPTAPADAAEIKAEKAPQVMPVLSEKAEASAKATVENHKVIDDLKNGNHGGKPVGVVEPKPTEYLGPPTVEVETMDPSDFGPAQPADDTDKIAKLPPSTDKIIFPDLEHSYTNKKGQEVTIVSNDAGFTISFKNNPPSATDEVESKSDRIPSIDSSVSYSYDKKTGKISKMVCFEVCRETELTLKGDKGAYIAALVAMKKAVNGAIKGLDGVTLEKLKLKFKLKMLDNALRELIKRAVYYRPFPRPIISPRF